jgi:hypothetical protein
MKYELATGARPTNSETLLSPVFAVQMLPEVNSIHNYGGIPAFCRKKNKPARRR